MTPAAILNDSGLSAQAKKAWLPAARWVAKNGRLTLTKRRKFLSDLGIELNANEDSMREAVAELVRARVYPEQYLRAESEEDRGKRTRKLLEAIGAAQT